MIVLSKPNAILVDARTIMLHLLWQCKKYTHFLPPNFTFLTVFILKTKMSQNVKKNWNKSQRINCGQTFQLSHFLLFYSVNGLDRKKANLILFTLKASGYEELELWV